MRHSELVQQALEQLGEPLSTYPPARLYKAYCQLIRGFTLHAKGEHTLAHMALSRFHETAQPMPIDEELEGLSGRHEYWRTAVMSSLTAARGNSKHKLGIIGWLRDVDPILYSGLFLNTPHKSHISSFRLLHHYQLEVRTGRALRFEGLEESQQRTRVERQMANLMKEQSQRAEQAEALTAANLAVEQSTIESTRRQRPMMGRLTGIFTRKKPN
jgi:hypothetical protein